jgi:hypothetical protein
VVNLAPVATNDDGGSVARGQTVTVAVLANDHDDDGGLVPATLAIVSAPSLGSATVVAGTVRYTRPGSLLLLLGTTALTYRICDTDGACAQATVQFSLPLLSL